jgi:hypothetical protein
MNLKFRLEGESKVRTVRLRRDVVERLLEVHTVRGTIEVLECPICTDDCAVCPLGRRLPPSQRFGARCLNWEPLASAIEANPYSLEGKAALRRFRRALRRAMRGVVVTLRPWRAEE